MANAASTDRRHGINQTITSSIDRLFVEFIDNSLSYLLTNIPACFRSLCTRHVCFDWTTRDRLQLHSIYWIVLGFLNLHIGTQNNTVI